MKTCTICQGTGFHKGKICVCISGNKDATVEYLKELFGMVDETKFKDPWEKNK